jgi:hypothetical protein
MKTKMLTLVLSLSMFWTAVALAAPAKPEMKEAATCNDGKTAYSVNPAEHRGLCSGHGGVATFADGSAPKSHAKKTEYK